MQAVWDDLIPKDPKMSLYLGLSSSSSSSSEGSSKGVGGLSFCSFCTASVVALIASANGTKMDDALPLRKDIIWMSTQPTWPKMAEDLSTPKPRRRS